MGICYGKDILWQCSVTHHKLLLVFVILFCFYFYIAIVQVSDPSLRFKSQNFEIWRELLYVPVGIVWNDEYGLFFTVDSV